MSRYTQTHTLQPNLFSPSVPVCYTSIVQVHTDTHPPAKPVPHPASPSVTAISSRFTQTHTHTHTPSSQTCSLPSVPVCYRRYHPGPSDWILTLGKKPSSYLPWRSSIHTHCWFPVGCILPYLPSHRGLLSHRGLPDRPLLSGLRGLLPGLPASTLALQSFPSRRARVLWVLSVAPAPPTQCVRLTQKAGRVPVYF